MFPRASGERHRHDRIGRTSPSHLRAALFALFAVSGFAGLIYESIWTQYLKLFLGHAAYAQALVLAIFMGGMAIGSFICSRWSPGWRKLLIAYAATEAAIGALGLIFHPLFTAVTGLAYETILPHLGAAVLPFKWLLGATIKYSMLPGKSRIIRSKISIGRPRDRSLAGPASALPEELELAFYGCRVAIPPEWWGRVQNRVFRVAMGHTQGASVGAGETILLSVRLRLALTFTLDLPQPRLHSDRPTLVGDETRSPAARSTASRGGRYHQHEPHLLPPSRHDQLQENREPPPAPAR